MNKKLFFFLQVSLLYLFNFTASYSISIQAFSVSFTSSDSNFRQTAQTLSW